MKIVDLTVTEFRYPAQNVQDSHGHAHPARAREARLALLTLVSDQGHKGYSFQGPEQLRPAVVEKYIRPIVVDENAYARERIWERLSHMQRGSSGILTDKALSAVDQALWDLAGRALNLPVAALIGQYRDAIPAYGSIMTGDTLEGGLSTPQEYGDFAKMLVERGYKAIKLHTWMPPTKGAPDLDRDIEACEAVRDAVGPKIALMLDGYHWYSRVQALRLGKAIEQLDFAWFEEPMEEASMSSYKWLSENLSIPVIGPETAGGKHFTRAEWIANSACDIVRVGVLRAGGITPALKAAHLAEAHGMECEMHGNGAASLAVCLSAPNSSWYERGLLHPFLDYEEPPPYLRQIPDQMDADGMVRASGLPGLGEAIDFEYIEENQTEREGRNAMAER